MGEMVASSKADVSIRAFLACDLPFIKHAVSLVVRRSKCDQLGRDKTIVFRRLKGSTICAVKALQNFWFMRPGIDS